MAKYRKKPVVVEAVTWIGNWYQSSPEWFNEAIQSGKIFIKNDDDGERILLIDTLEGEMIAMAGDYIIKGIKGEIYPCKPDIFEATYEKVEG
jgi:hypothetical protein